MADRDRGDRRSGGRRPRRERSGPAGRFGSAQRGRRRRLCQFCVDGVDGIDYKDVSLLRQYLSGSGSILGRRRTGTCARHQRMLTRAVKRARHVALLPYTAEHVRATGGGSSID